MLMVIEISIVLAADSFSAQNMPRPPAAAADYNNTEMLGKVLYTDYVYPFEIAALILLVAIIAAIALTLRKRPDTKYLDPVKQISVRREDRVRLVKMPAERRQDGS